MGPCSLVLILGQRLLWPLGPCKPSPGLEEKLLSSEGSKA